MPQDAFTLKYLCLELNSIFAGGKVNRIVQPSNDEVVFTIYTGKKTERLLLDVNPALPRIGMPDGEKESPLTAPNFCMLLRKHLLSATIDKIELVGFDRIVRIEFTASQEFFDAEKKILYVELMGRYSNVILTENGKILGGNRGINMFDDGVRPLIVGKPYVFPPTQDKFVPWDEEIIARFREYNTGDIADFICKTVQGLAKSTAREIEVSFAQNKGINVEVFESNFTRYAQEFFKFLNDFICSAKPLPCVYLDGDSATDVCVYPYKVLQGDYKVFSSLCQAEEYYFKLKNTAKKFTNKKERLKSIIASAIKKAKKRLTAISSKQKDAEKLEENRIKGELLISNIYRIKDGVCEVILDNYYDDNKPIKITLDKSISVSKNAENYFKKYNKQKRTLIALTPQYESAKIELEYFESIADEIALCENEVELNFVAKEMATCGLITEPKKNNKKREEKQTFREYIVDGYKFFVGRNNSENDQLLSTCAKDDLWLHAKDYHSSHVVIVSNGKSVPEKVILTASEVCAYYSKGRESGRAEIVYTKRKNVKKPRGAKAGFVTYDEYSSILVAPNKREEYLKSN